MMYDAHSYLTGAREDEERSCINIRVRRDGRGAQQKKPPAKKAPMAAKKAPMPTKKAVAKKSYAAAAKRGAAGVASAAKKTRPMTTSGISKRTTKH